MGVCNCSMFCCTLLYVYSSIAIILMGKRELIALLNLSSWCLAVPWGFLQFVIVVSPDHTHLLFLKFALIITIQHKTGCIAAKFVFGLSDKVIFKPARSATETS